MYITPLQVEREKNAAFDKNKARHKYFALIRPYNTWVVIVGFATIKLKTEPLQISQVSQNWLQFATWKRKWQQHYWLV